MSIFNQYKTLTEFDIVAKYTKESGLGTDLIAGLKSIKQNWDHLDEDITDSYDEIMYQLSVFIEERDYHA